MTKRPIQIGGRVYRINPEVDRYQIPFDELDDFRIGQVPGHCHVEITGRPEPPEGYSFELYALNAGDDDTDQNLYIYGGAYGTYASVEDARRKSAKLQRTFHLIGNQLDRRSPSIEMRDGKISAHYSLTFEHNQEALVKESASPIFQGFRNLGRSDALLFMCHASEDKPRAREITLGLRTLGAEVWLDECEIRVGESIVQKINGGLAQATHLVILLSRESCQKPWVTRELSSALMRQLTNNSIKVLPVRLDDCEIPALLADIRYADYRRGVSAVVAELEAALFPVGLAGSLE